MRTIWAAVAACALTACTTTTGGEAATTTSPASVIEATPATTASATDTTLPVTTPSTAPVATEAPTTAAPASTTPPPTAPTAPPTTVVPPAVTEPNGPAPLSAIAIVDAALVELDPASGAVVRTISDLFSADGVFRGNLHLTPDGGSAYFDEGYEDSWFSCDSSAGQVGLVDLTSGETTAVAPGAGPTLSHDGTLLAYRESTVCVPDPDNPDIWVLTPYDRVVVLDLISGDRISHDTATAPTSYEDPNALIWTGFDGENQLLVATGAGSLHRIDPLVASVVQDAPVVLEDVSDFRWPVEVVGNGLLALEFGDEGSADLYVIELGSGDEDLLVTSETTIEVGVSPTGNVAVAGTDPVLVSDAAITLIVLEDWPFGLDW